MNKEKWYEVELTEEQIKKAMTNKSIFEITIEEKNKEIERLNNIINEIKKIVDYYGITPDVNDDITVRYILKEINNKLELKEGKE